MSIPVLSLLPQLGPSSAPTSSAVANGGGSASKGNGFGGLLASLSSAPAAASKSADQDGHSASQAATVGDAKGSLEQALSALAGGKVDLSAPGLGLSAQQQQRLLANLQKLLDSSQGDGAELLASLLAASQLGATIQPKDLAALTQLLGTTAQGTVSIDALDSNLHLLAQAVQLVASSDGKVTLVQAVQELTSPGDAFTQQLAAAIAQPETQADASDVPVTIDTGPPKDESPGDAAASASAGSNGREMTVTPTGATSPADGATNEANGAAGDNSEVSELAKAIEALFQSQPQAKSAQPAQAATAAAAVDGSKTALIADAAQPVAAAASPAAQLAQMAPAQAASAQAGASQPTQPVALRVAQATAPVADEKAGDKPVGGTQTAGPMAVAGSVAGIAPQLGGHSQPGEQHEAGQQQTSSSSSSIASQQAVASVAAPAPSAFASVLEVSGASAPQAPAPPLLGQAIVDQIVQNATLALRNGEQEFRIQLKPDFLGAMEVRVSMDNGVVSVRMSAESTATRQLIDNNISQLRQAFGTGEARVEHVPNFASSDAPWTFNQGGQQGFWQGQSPYSGSPLPEAIPYREPEPETAAVAGTSSTLETHSSPASKTPGAVDLHA
jgi:flagellar hook-length control protein FliK